MGKKSLFLWCVWWSFQMVVLKAQNIVQPKLKPAEWWTAPYMEVFRDADIKYAFNPKDAYEMLDTIVQRATHEKSYKWIYSSL